MVLLTFFRLFTLPFMISFMVYSSYSSFTLPLTSPSSGNGGGGKQFSITRCFRRPLLWPLWNPFAIPFADDASGQGAVAVMSGVAVPEVARDEAGVNTSRRK